MSILVTLVNGDSHFPFLRNRDGQITHPTVIELQIMGRHILLLLRVGVTLNRVYFSLSKHTMTLLRSVSTLKQAPATGSCAAAWRNATILCSVDWAL